MRFRPRHALLIVLVCAIGGIAAFYHRHGLYGLNVLLRRAGTVFVTVMPDDPRLSPSMRAALSVPSPGATADRPGWQLRQPGLETAEMPIRSEAGEVDTLLLTRLDPAQFRFEVLIAPAGNRELGDWMRERWPAVVINGSYFDARGHPDTPVKSMGVAAGPREYAANHGMFVSDSMGTSIEELRGRAWQPLLDAARDAMVSYPLLLARDGTTRVKSDRRWLANRSFVGQDTAGRIVLGTTRQAYFSLERFGVFLRDAPLDLAVALNLDGGPLACQAVRSAGFERDFCGDWETQTSGDDIILLRRVVGTRRWGLPIVLAAFPRD